MGDEVSGEEDKVGREGVDVVDDAFEEEGSVNSSRWMSLIWTMRKPWKGAGRLAMAMGRWTMSSLVAGDLAGVKGESGGGGAGADEEVSAGEA